MTLQAALATTISVAASRPLTGKRLDWYLETRAGHMFADGRLEQTTNEARGADQVLRDGPKTLRSALNGPGLLWGPGVFDGISVRLAIGLGFPILYMGGAGTAATHIGEADVGLATMTEMAENVRMLHQIADAPLIADADQGFGSLLSAVRAVHLYEAAGAAGMHIEDQGFPKRCGHLEGKIVVSRREFRQRIAAAVGERNNPDFVIIARVDARSPLGFDEAWRRIEDGFAAGADVGFLEAPESLDEIVEIAKRADGRPMLLNNGSGGKTPPLTVSEIEDLGFKLAIWPGIALKATVMAIRHAYEVLKSTGSDQALERLSTADLFSMLGIESWLAIERKYGQLE